MNCPACGQPSAPRLHALLDATSGQRFDLLGCSKCGHGVTAPVPQDLAAVYAADYHGTRHGFTARLCWKRRLARIAAAGATARRLLDIGCGDGSLLQLAQQRGMEVAGTEFSVEAARSKGLDVRRELRDFVGTAPFDVITSWHSLEHMTDPVAVLRDAHALLHPQGTLLLAVPDARCWSALLFGRHWLHLDAPRHLHHFSSRSIEHMLRAAGYQPVHRFGGEAEYDLMGWSQSLLDALGLPRQAFFKMLTGKSQQGLVARAVHCALGAAATALVFVPWLLSITLRSPGTLVVAARKGASAQHGAS